jgi:hypothetical protein
VDGYAPTCEGAVRLRRPNLRKLREYAAARERAFMDRHPSLEGRARSPGLIARATRLPNRSVGDAFRSPSRTRKCR